MTTKHNFHAIIGPNGMCKCGVRADGTVVTCDSLLREHIEALLLQRAQEIAELQKERDRFRKDAAYHADCRPNRQQAEAAMADAKATNDRWADEVAKNRELEAQLAARAQEIEQVKATLEASRDLLVGVQHRMSYIPHQGYSTTMSAEERKIAEGIAAIDTILKSAAEAALVSRAPQPEQEAKSPEWGLANVYTIARRRLRKLPEGHSEREWWQHVVRIAEESGVKQPGVLRHSVPTEITGG